MNQLYIQSYFLSIALTLVHMMKRIFDWSANNHTGSSNSSARQSSQQQPQTQQSFDHQTTQPKSPQSPCSQQQQQQSPRELEIQHLTKLFHEIKYYQATSPLPSAASSQNHRDFIEKIHKTLPLFLNVFANELGVNTSALQSPQTHKRYSSSPGVGSIDRHLDSGPPAPLLLSSNTPLPLRCPSISRFPDIGPFTHTIARLFVSEVRKKASNKHAEHASLSILKYLSPQVSEILGDLEEITTDQKPTISKPGQTSESKHSESSLIDESTQGWNLLISLNTLALSQNSNVIQLLCDASVPSTLIKCLYLFYDLQPLSNLKLQSQRHDSLVEGYKPHGIASSVSFDEDNPILPPANQDNRLLTPLIRAFTQLLISLCSYQEAINELIKKDDLRLLFGLASTQCQPHNRPWREVAFQTLIAISKNMSDSFLYLKENQCVHNYVENMYRVNSLGLVNTDEFVDMAKTLLEFLYNLDVNNRNQPRSIAPIIDQFCASRFIELVEDLIFKIDDIIRESKPKESESNYPSGSVIQSVSQQPSISSEIGDKADEYRPHGRRLLQSLSFMAKINANQETMLEKVTIRPVAANRYDMFETFKMPKPSARNCILNYDFLRLIKSVWSKCRDTHLIEAILDTIISLFNDDKYNYFIFESQQLLVYFMTSENFHSFPLRVKQKLFKFIEFITIETNYIPCLELGTFGTLIKEESSSNSDLILVLRTLIACLRFNPKFNDVFRDIGLLEIIIETLIKSMPNHQVTQSKETNDGLEVLYLSLEASQCLLSGPNIPNCTQFNESGASRHVFNCLSNPRFFYLFLPQKGSSSDDSVDINQVGTSGPRSHTPPLSALIRSSNTAAALYTPLNQMTYSRPAVKQIQKVAFTIIRQLILSSGDEQLANLLGLLARSVDELESMIVSNGTESPEINQTEKDASNEVDVKKIDLDFLVAQEMNLKTCVLKSLIIILRESHRCRTLFRKTGGFIHIVSTLETLSNSLPLHQSEGSMEDEVSNNTCSEVWKKMNSRRIWRLIKNCLMTIVVAMRSEPTNIRSFTEEALPKLVEAIRRLGCFKASQKKLEFIDRISNAQFNKSFTRYRSIFLSPPTRDFSTLSRDNVDPHEACCQLFRFLYDMALDMGDGTSELEVELEHLSNQMSLKKNDANVTTQRAAVPSQNPYSVESKSISFDRGNNYGESNVFKRRSQLSTAPKRPPSLDLNVSKHAPALLTFPSIVLAILDLIPSCSNEDLILFISLVIESLLKHERNQHLLCEAGMVTKLLEPNLVIAISQKSHLLHKLFSSFLEKLMRHSVTVKELTTFLRIGEPMKCKNLADIAIDEQVSATKPTHEESAASLDGDCSLKVSEKIPIDRIETIVSILSSNKLESSERLPTKNAHEAVQAPFIEFDMSMDGLSLIFMPSIAPINVKSLHPQTSSFLNNTLDIHTNEKNGILGGVGTQERQFPPPNGFTFSTWILIEKFPARSPDPNHNLRLITIYRGSASTGKEYSCFRLQISSLDRALILSTEETMLFETDNRSNDSQLNPDYNVRIWTPELILENRWHHIAISMQQSPTKQANLQVYVDGIQAHVQRLCYISNLVGPVISGPLGHPSSGNNGSQAAFVNALIGSLPQFKCQAQTRWKQGPCHLLEEALNSNFIAVIYALGPNFIGNFQSSIKLNELAKSGLNQLSQVNPKFHKQIGSSKLFKHHQSVVMTSSARDNNDQKLCRVSSAGHSHETRHSHSSPQAGNYSMPEERILISIDARATSLMTLARMRKIYTRFDCRQIGRVLGLSLHENSTPILLLHNTSLHLTGPSRGVGAVTIGHNYVRSFVPRPLHQTLFSIGGCNILLAFIAQSESIESFQISMKALVLALQQNPALTAQMLNMNGYQTLSVFFRIKRHLLNETILKMSFELITNTGMLFTREEPKLKVIQQLGAIRELICESFDLWVETNMINSVLEFLYDLINSSTPTTVAQIHSNHAQQNPVEHPIPSAIINNSRTKNLKYLRDLDLLPRILRLLSKHDDAESNLSTDHSKSIYLIRQIVFELLNRTPRQPDLLYFGQFLASLLPHERQERSPTTIGLRNILLKSLLQMMTRNKQREVNQAMQEELVRILGFDWFILFIDGEYLDDETVHIGFLNLMVVLSNDDLYESFRNKQAGAGDNGAWLKEPTFPTIDGKFNIQLLGINVGVFFGLSGKRKSIRQDVINAQNLFLFTNSLKDLVFCPNIYLMLFMLMTDKFNDIESNVLDTISTFENLSLDSLCDNLVGDSHHKRRQVSVNLKFKCQELVVCVVYMIRHLMCDLNHPKRDQPTEEDLDGRTKQRLEYPTEITKFIMYLYNNNREFQNFCCHSDELIAALSESLMFEENRDLDTAIWEDDDDDWTRRARSRASVSTEKKLQTREMTHHPACKEILELSRLIILDNITQSTSSNELSLASSVDHLQAFERFIRYLEPCDEARGELIDMLMIQILLMIDSSTRNDTIRTIASSENLVHFQLLLINSITISQIVTDKIWQLELYNDQHGRILKFMDHLLCLTEQIFKFNEILPKSSPPYAFNMQETLNRIILFALSRPTQNMSDKIIAMDLLKKIHDNRTLIILNHMQSERSAEFFVCFSFLLMRIIEDNSPQAQNVEEDDEDQPISLIQHRFNNQPRHLGPSSLAKQDDATNIMIVSMARKVWDSIYQSKKCLLSEALDVSLSLPAFTLETSLDLMQLKPDIQDTCQRFWSVFFDREQQPKTRRAQSRTSEATSTASNATSTVNLLSGRLTKVVNAASFVSRVVGATAGSMASNVNLVSERLSQTSRSNRKESHMAASTPRSATESSASGSPGITNIATNHNNFGSDQFASPMTSNYAYNRFTHAHLRKTDVGSAYCVHISIISDYIAMQNSQKNHNIALYKYICEEWLDMENELLLRERAIFGPTQGSKLDKWCLDMTEGPRRMRKKMLNNTRRFYKNYPYLSENFNVDNKSLRYRPPMSYDSRDYHLKNTQMHQQFLELDYNNLGQTSKLPTNQSCKSSEQKSIINNTDEQAQQQSDTTDLMQKQTIVSDSPSINIDSPSEAPGSPTHSRESTQPQAPSKQSEDSPHESSQLIQRVPGPSNQALSSRSSDQGDGDGDADSTSFVDFSPEIEAENNSARESENFDSLSVLRLLEKDERISHMFRCSRVQGLDTYEGLMLFGREHFYLIDGFTLLKTREIKDIDSLPPDSHDPIIPNSTPNLLAHSKKTCSKFAFEGIIEVHKRRYLLQPIALEVFSSDGRNTLVVFPRNIRNKVYSRLTTVATKLNSNTHESLAGQKSNVSVEGGSGLLSNLIGETSVTQRWVRGELSNFQYLMNLNTIAGRSYNDLMQYPIFPWVLADYTSDYLDLSKPSTFRDLSRPVGAQTSERLEQFKRRFAEWDDTETPPYHYGTFYSSAMIVASYMVRMEPFTQHFLRLQGGHFDLADRMFHSIHDSWLSASKHNMADIKELIPEFFYLPEFLKNENRYDLGIKQNGMKLDNVILPPWAKGDAREFICLHRSALESDYVSAHLHEWIDLIFGYKQQGQAAIDAVNVFHHLFYEGNVDIYNTEIDPIKKNAVIGFINNFGQVPKQLFKRPHPARKQLSSSHYPSMSGTPSPILPSLSVAAHSAQQLNAQRNITHCSQSLKPSPSNLKDLKGPVGQIVQIDKTLVAVEQNKLLIPPECCRYVAWGHADRSLRLGLYESERPIFVWEGCEDLAPSDVLCCTIPNNRIMITGSTDSLITVWKIDKVKSFSPIMNLYGHTEPVTCLASSQAYSIVVSGSRDRTAIIWDLNKFTFSRQLGDGNIVHQAPVSAIAINDSTGDIATCASSWLYLWTINGQLLTHIDSLVANIQRPTFGGSTISSLPGQLQLLSVCFSQFHEWSSNEVIVTGSSCGSIAIWSVRFVQVPDESALLEFKQNESKPRRVRPQLVKMDSTASEDFEDDKSPDQSNEPTQQASQDISLEIAKQNAIEKRRKRTDTINSDWVRLSHSSTSTIDTLDQQNPVGVEIDSTKPVSSALSPAILDDNPASSTDERAVSIGPVPVSLTSEPDDEYGDPRCSTPVTGVGLDCLGSSQTLSGGHKSMGDSRLNLFVNTNDSSLIKFSKSDTSLVDSFVILGDTLAPNGAGKSTEQRNHNTRPNEPRSQSCMDGTRSNPPEKHNGERNAHPSRSNKTSSQRSHTQQTCKLLPNHRWARQLYLRTLLTRCDGRGNWPSAPVTTLTISKDHRTIYAGDASGKVFVWSI